MDDPKPSGIVRFGVFELDPRSGELRRSGYRIKIQEQPFKVLMTLLEHPGEVVTREELQRLIWPEESFGDFDHALSVAVAKLRTALNDSADAPRFIETLSRRGYRFIGDNIQLPSVGNCSVEHEGLRSAPATSVQPDGHADNHTNWTKIGVRILIGAAGVVTAFLFYMRWRPHAEQLAALTPIPFTAFPGQEVVPTFSPDGTQVAFAWTGGPVSESKGFDLYVKVIGSENILQLTHRPSEWISPAWSPDGSQILFHRLSGADTGLYVVSALGGPERRLLVTHILRADNTPISWSPDGKWIAFEDQQSGTGKIDLKLLSLDDLKSSQLPETVGCVSSGLPAFSHDGRRLAYGCANSSIDTDIIVVTIGKPTPRKIATFYGRPIGSTWTDDDARLIVGVDQGGGSELLEFTLANGSHRTLPFGQGLTWPAISPKGNRLAFTTSSDNVNVWRKDLSHSDSTDVKLLASTREQTNASYSPDGRHIAFESTRGGAPEIWISDADGKDLMQLSKMKNYATGTPRWSPDGRKIAFDAWHAAQAEIYIVDMSELIPHKLVTNIEVMFQPSWSQDGQSVYFLSGLFGATRVYRCPANGGPAVLVSDALAVNHHESLDGSALFFVDRLFDGTLKKRSVGQYGLDSPVEGMPLLKDAALWTIVSGGIYFVPSDAPRSVCYLDLSTHHVRRITTVKRDFNAINGGLSVSSDGRWLLYSQVDEINSDIMLVDHFH